MSVISLVSPKGGCGKTTAALVIATELAEADQTVTIIDADPQHWISDWADKDGKPINLDVMKATEDDIAEKINQATNQTQHVIVDCEGTQNLLVVYAIAKSDLVIVPTQASHMDGRSAGKSIKLIKTQEEILGKKIAFAVLLTRSRAAIRSRSQVNIEGQLEAGKIPLFQTQLLEREAYRLLFSKGGTLANLPANTYNKDAAIKNAKSVAGEAIHLIRQAQQSKKGAS